MVNKIFWIGQAKIKLAIPLSISNEETATAYFQSFYVVASDTNRAIKIIQLAIASDSLVSCDPPIEVAIEHIPQPIKISQDYLYQESILYQSGKVYFHGVFTTPE